MVKVMIAHEKGKALHPGYLKTYVYSNGSEMLKSLQEHSESIKDDTSAFDYDFEKLSNQDINSRDLNLSERIVLVDLPDILERTEALEALSENHPHSCIIVVMRRFDTNLELQHFRHGAFDVVSIEDNSTQSAAIIINRVYRTATLINEMSVSSSLFSDNEIEPLLEAVLTLVPAPVAVVTKGGEIRYANPEFTKLIGSPFSKAMNSSINDWFTIPGSDGKAATKDLDILASLPIGETKSLTVKLAQHINVGRKIRLGGVKIILDRQKNYLIIANEENRQAMISHHALLKDIYARHNQCRPNRGRFTQWIDDTSAQVQESERKSISVIAIQFWADPQDERRVEIAPWKDSIEAASSSLLSMFTSDYMFADWDTETLAIGFVASGYPEHLAVFNRMHTLVTDSTPSGAGVNMPVVVSKRLSSTRAIIDRLAHETTVIDNPGSEVNLQVHRL